MSVHTIVITAAVSHRARNLALSTAVETRVRTTLLRTGPPGQMGEPGEPGAPGPSAYSVYLETTSDDPPLDQAAWAASRESVMAAEISDSTALGRAILTAETASAARTELDIEAAITADVIRSRLNTNLMPAGAWSMGTNWTNNGNGTYTSNNASGFNSIISPSTGNPNPKGLWLLVYDVIAVTSGRVSPFWSPSGNGSFLQLAGQNTPLAGATCYWIGNQRSNGDAIQIRTENGFVGTIGNIRLLRLL